MYIAERYWGEYIGGSDDSLTLLDHLAAKGRAGRTMRISMRTARRTWRATTGSSSRTRSKG